MEEPAKVRIENWEFPILNSAFVGYHPVLEGNVVLRVIGVCGIMCRDNKRPEEAAASEEGDEDEPRRRFR
jgi:hypothetical protein